MRGTLIALVEMFTLMHFLEYLGIMLLNSLSPVNGSCVGQKNRVLCVKRTESGGIAAVKCLVGLLTERAELLGYLWLTRSELGPFVGCGRYLLLRMQRRLRLHHDGSKN
jgi:hypothetical protein